MWIDGKCVVQDGTCLTLRSMDLAAMVPSLDKIREIFVSLAAWG